MFGVAFDRPWALALFALPLALLLLARFLDRPLARYTGAFELWLAVALARPADARARRRRVPPPTWLYALGLACATLAAAGPRPSGSDAPWRVLVDRTPSMYLQANTAPGAPTRIERAAELLAARLTGSELEWIDVGADPPASVRAGALPAAWRTAPRFVRPEMEWSAHDAAGTVWLTDRAPAAPARATLCTSGGDAAAGLVGARGAVGRVWDGVAIREVPLGASVGEIVLPDELDATWSDVIGAWAAAREFVTSSGPGNAARLRIHRSPGSAPPRVVEFGRDGWRARATVREPAPGRDEHGPLATWLAGDDGVAIVTVGSGRLHLAVGESDGCELLSGAEAFAVSFARLLDALVEPAPGVVVLAERAAAGDARFVLGPPPEPVPASRVTAAQWASGLALLALFAIIGAAIWMAASARTGDAARASG